MGAEAGLAPDAPRLVVRDRLDGIRELRLNRPHVRNAFDRALMEALTETLVRAEEDPHVRVLVLSATGSDFSSGWDRGELAEPDVERRRGTSRAFGAMMTALEQSSVPLVAAVRGAAVGIGFTLLAHCDLVVLADDARMRAPFVSLGLVPEAGSSHLLPALLGRHRAAELLLTGRWWPATEAVAWGFGNRTCPADEVERTALRLAQEVAASATGAVRATKMLMGAAGGEELVRARRRESEVFRRLGDGLAGG